MQITASDAFVAMYYALEAATDEYHCQELEAFLRDSNPFIWKDRASADPAVYADFSESFSSNCGKEAISAQKARAFCREWLNNQAKNHELYAGPLVAAFDSVATAEDWENALINL